MSYMILMQRLSKPRKRAKAAETAVRAEFKHGAAGSNSGSEEQLEWTEDMSKAVAVRVDAALAPSTLRGYRPAFGIWLSFLKECMAKAYDNPLLWQWSIENQVNVLCLFMLWCNGDWVPDSGTTSTAIEVNKSKSSGLANITLLSQGLEHEFLRMGASVAAFSNKRFRRVKKSYHLDAREQSKLRDKNVKLPANWEMLDGVSSEWFDDIVALPRNLVEKYKGVVSKGEELGIDIAMTALSLEHSAINVSRIGEYAYTGNDSEHMIQNEDVSLLVKKSALGNGELMYSNEIFQLEAELGRGLNADDLEEAVFVLRSSKTQQLGLQTRVTSIIPNTPRARAYLNRILIWIRIKQGKHRNEEMFFQRTANGREKRLMSSMVNSLWRWVENKYNLPERSLSSKSAKQMGIAILDSVQEGKAPPEASFHKSVSAQNHYRHPAVGVAGTCQILNTEGASFSLSAISSMARLKGRSGTQSGDCSACGETSKRPRINHEGKKWSAPSSVVSSGGKKWFTPGKDNKKEK